MMIRISIAVLAALVAAAALTLPHPRPPEAEQPLPAWSDLLHRCRYIVVDLSADGLEIAITGEGASACARRIHVNGIRVVPERRI